jgi:WD40 repeat protein
LGWDHKTPTAAFQIRCRIQSPHEDALMYPVRRLLLLTACLALGLGFRSHAEPPPAKGRKPAPEGKQAVRTDRYGDPLPPGVLARLGTVRLRHPDCDYVTSVTFSPDGKILASAGSVSQWFGRIYESPFRIRLWDAATGIELRRLGGYSVGINCVRFSPDGRTLASAGLSPDEEVCLWEAASGKKSRAFNIDWWSSVAFSPDVKTLASPVDRNTLRLWSLTSGKPVRELRGQKDPGWSLAFSPDGKLLASAGQDSGVYLWEVATGKKRRQLRHPKVTSVAFSPDGKSLASGGEDKAVRFWELATGKELRNTRGKGEKDAVGCLAFSPDGKTLAAGTDNAEVQILQVATGIVQRRCRAQAGSIRSVAFSPDGKTVAAGSEDQTVCLWDVTTGQQRLPFPGHRGCIEAGVYAPDGKAVATAGQDGTIRFWEAATGKHLRLFQKFEGPVWCLSFSPDGKTFAAGGERKTIFFWDVATGKELGKLRGHGGRVLTLAFSPDGKALASGGDGQTVHLWNISTGKEIRTIRAKGEAGGGTAGAFSRDGKVLAVAGNGRTVQLWDVATGIRVSELRGGEKYRVNVVTFSPDGKTVAAAGKDGAVYVWDVASRQELSRFTSHQGWDPYFGGSAIAFSPDGRTLATGGLSKPISLWEVATGEEIRQFDVCLTDTHNEIRSLAFSPDGRTLAAGGKGDFTVLIWDVTGLCQEGGLPRRDLPPGEVKRLWTALGGDAIQADRAVWKLVAAEKQALVCFTANLRPAATAGPRRLARLMRDLEHARFAVRHRATKELEQLGDVAELALRRALAGRPSVEVRQRVERLLQRLPAERVRTTRTVAVLERLGNPGARALLAKLAKGAPQARLTQEAEAALKRLARRPAVSR